MLVRKLAILSLGAMLLAGLANQAHAQTRPSFERGELIIGYQSESDREHALQELTATKDKITIRGQTVEPVEVQAIGGSALKLRLSLPTEVQRQADSDPTAELQILQELATKLKNSDSRIKYAHPNWILDKMSRRARFPDAE